ncbi:MAG: chemotaxis protein CheW [Reichenbachiella sp.]
MTTATQELETIDIGSSLSDKYLTFKLSDEDYAIQILTVQRIIQMQEITPIPKTPEYVRGVLNMRGSIIPVVDIRNKFGMDSKADSDISCIVIIQLAQANGPLTMGIVIDAVSEVLFIEADEIQETPSFGNDVKTDFIMGIAKCKERVIMLLDINKVLSESEVSSLSAIQ